MFNSLLKFLRGPSQSLRYRFVKRPWLWFCYELPVLIQGKPRLEYWARITDMAQAPRIRVVPEDSYMALGKQQFDYMVEIGGLKPEHRLLDYGCGPMRGGLHFAKYLLPGNYVGADISGKILERGIFLLTSNATPRKDFHAVRITNYELSELYGFEFDRVYSHSAFQYLSDDEFRITIRSIRNLLTPDAEVHFTFPDESHLNALQAKAQYFRDQSTVQRICEEEGYSFSCFPKSSKWLFGDVAILKVRSQ